MSQEAVEREEVYGIIDSERDYQDWKWGAAGHDHGVGDYILFMQHYLEQARTNMTLNRDALDEIRKVAALAVACMEDNGARARKLEAEKT